MILSDALFTHNTVHIRMPHSLNPPPLLLALLPFQLLSIIAAALLVAVPTFRLLMLFLSSSTVSTSTLLANSTEVLNALHGQKHWTKPLNL